MKSPNDQDQSIEDALQHLLALLQRSREELTATVVTAQSDYDWLAADLSATDQMVEAQAAEIPRLEEGVADASLQFDSIVGDGGTDPVVIHEAAMRLSQAHAELRIARDREKAQRDWSERLLPLQTNLSSVAARSSKLAADLDLNTTTLGPLLRHLATRLESAQQSRGLGLHVIRAQEEERRRLAREIHDGPAQLLNSVVLRINVCQRLVDTDLPRLNDELTQLKDLVRLSLQDVRKIIFDLRPMALDDLGLVPALRAFLKDYQAKTGIETDFDSFGNESRYDSAFEVAIFRLVQEALSNVYKHAGATRVWVKVETAGGREVRLVVRDDGAGFDPTVVLDSGTGTKFGLVGMRERAELLGGSMEILSAPGQGSRINFVFPLGE